MDAVARMEALLYMLQTEGWQVVSGFIQERIEANKNDLLHCPLGKVEIHRAKIQAYESILKQIEDMIEEGKEEQSGAPP